MPRSHRIASIHPSLAVAFLLFNLVTFLSSTISSTTIFTAEALPRPRLDGRGLSSSASAASVIWNPFLNQNVELTGNDGNHHDLVRAIMGSTSSASSTSLTMIRKKSKRQLNGNNRVPVLTIDHSRYSHQLEVDSRSKRGVRSKLRKREVTPPPEEPGSGGIYNEDQPQDRRRELGTA